MPTTSTSASRTLRLAWSAVVASIAAAAGFGAGPAEAARSEWVSTEFADVRLVSATAAVGDRAEIPLGLHFRLADGWKVYWRSAGDAGYAPIVEFDGSENLKEATWRYPVPERFSLFGLETFGYHGEVVYPITAAVSEPGRPLRIKADMNALVCSDICVPMDAALALTVPAGPEGPTPFTQLIDRYRAQVPTSIAGAGIDVAAVTAVGEPVAHSLAVTVTATAPLAAPDVFPEAPKGYSFGKPELTLSPDRMSATLIVPASVPKDGALLGLPVTMTAVDGDRFVERAKTVGEGAASPVSQGPAAEDTGLWATMLAFAFLGGLILNLMPCVLPVLSIKLLGAISYGGAGLGVIRQGFLASAAGIVVSFMALAAAAIGVKEAGIAVGWGIQFQQPLFLTVLALILVAFAANLWGLFEVGLPSWLSDRLASAPAGPGSGGTNGEAAHGSLGGHFMTGAFATLLATPCSAPFLGTAVGFALSRGTVEIAAIFFMMGVGLATPYLLVAAFPRIANALPRPGAWMVRVRQVLGLALAATAVWLISVIAAQVSLGLTAGIAAALVALVAATAVGKRAERLRFPSAVTTAGAFLSALVALGLGAEATRTLGTQTPALKANTTHAIQEGDAIEWVAFDTAALAGLVGDGKTVLVDVTADWCLTCKVNKAIVLDADPVAGTLGSEGVTAMRADWTRPNQKIADYLASFGRYGIPFNAVYGPKAPNGIPLPEVLTTKAVMDAVARASGGAVTAAVSD